MCLIFEDPEAEAAILVDASNTFNNLNCQSALINIRLSCLTFAKVTVNMDHENKFLFIDGETIFLFNEVATQGDPLAMAMYITDITALIRKLQKPVHEIWYTDDAGAGGKLKIINDGIS